MWAGEGGILGVATRVAKSRTLRFGNTILVKAPLNAFIGAAKTIASDAGP
jgi:hypothetical protein